MKFGDYGVHSRTYRRPSSGSSDCCSCGTIGKIVVVIAFLLEVWNEYSYHKQLESLDTILNNSSLQEIHGSLSNDVQLQDGHSYFFSGIPFESVSALNDDDFKISFGASSSSIRRVVEYCQWMEIRTESKVQVNGEEIVEVTFHYEKAWRNHRINSLFFDSALAYNNPGRDPFPPFEHDSIISFGSSSQVGVLSQGLTHEDDSVLPEAVQIPRDLAPTEIAISEGCTKSDAYWIYCHYEPPISPTLTKLASFAFEGVIDIGIEGRCQAGDIRVRWERVPLGTSATFVATAHQTDAYAAEEPTRQGFALNPYEGVHFPTPYLYLPEKHSRKEVLNEHTQRAGARAHSHRQLYGIVAGVTLLLQWCFREPSENYGKKYL